jgi:hypothetical protein
MVEKIATLILGALIVIPALVAAFLVSAYVGVPMLLILLFFSFKK